MAVYKIVDSEKLDKDLKGVANAIRSRGGTTENFTFPEGFKSAIINIPQEGGGSGGGIIDVTELPTVGIDENAVYRVTEEVIVRPTNAFLILFPGTVGGWLTMEQYLENQNIHPETLNVFDVEELPPVMEPTDITEFKEMNVYLSRADGKCYVYVAEYGMALTIGYMLGDPSVDKGSLDNLLDATEAGIYTTFKATENFLRYFVREGSEWKEITAYVSMSNMYNLETSSAISGDITSIVYNASTLLEKAYTEIDESWFLKGNGEYINVIKDYVFGYSNQLVTATIPNFIKEVSNRAFANCDKLKTATFKGKPNYIDQYCFQGCNNLTTINVPWSEGEVTNAPWYATNATINYNYTEG